MSDILDKVYESLASRTDLNSFDRRIYELLLAFHRLPLPNYNMPPLSMLAFRSNQSEKAVMQCIFRLRDAGLVRVLTDRSGIFPAYYRVIENPVLPEPVALEPEPESDSCQVYWVVPCVECTITFVDIETPEPDQVEEVSSGIDHLPATQITRQVAVVRRVPLVLSVCSADSFTAYPEVVSVLGGLCRAGVVGLAAVWTNHWLGLFVPR